MPSNLRQSCDTTHDKPLGRIESSIVGRQYYEHGAELKSACPLIFEREPENQYDSNAIAVENGAFQKVGHIPRRQAAWLAPLIDEGMVRIEGETRDLPVPPEISWPCLSYISVFLTKRGEPIFQKASPKSQPESVHQLVLDVYRQMEELDDMDHARWLCNSIEPMVSQEGTLPETHLLYSLIKEMPSQITKIALEKAVGRFAKCLNMVKPGKPQRFETWTIYPLSWLSSDAPEPVLLVDALNSGMATLEEMDEDGQIDLIRLTSRGRMPILVPEGDVLIGAKQNRVINVSVLVPPGETVELPVSCVEKDRWDHATAAFESRHAAPASLRAKKLRSIYEGPEHYHGPSWKRESDQGEIWVEVAQCLSSVGVNSETASLSAGLDAMEERASLMREVICLPESTSGVIVARGDRIHQIELFSSPKPFAPTWEKLMPAILLDEAATSDAANHSPELVDGIFTRLAQSATASQSPFGQGIELAITSPTLTGTALMQNDQLLHLSAFPASN